MGFFEIPSGWRGGSERVGSRAFFLIVVVFYITYTYGVERL